jgi:hypothetical protein
MSRTIHFILWLLWDFSGLRFICGKIKPPSKERTDNLGYKQPATFLLWLIGIYVALFGVASQRFENAIDRIENRTNAILALVLKDETRGTAFRLIPSVQGMRVQKKPEILNPIITLQSIFLGKTEGHEDSIEILKETIVGFKKQLVDAYLRGANLGGANLKRADLGGADLREARNLTSEQLSEVKTLYKARLDLDLVEQIKKDYPDLYPRLLEKPKD